METGNRQQQEKSEGIIKGKQLTDMATLQPVKTKVSRKISRRTHAQT
jgi:hypothetical protein